MVITATSQNSSILKRLKELNYDTDHEDNPNTAFIRKTKSEYCQRTRGLENLWRIRYAVVNGSVIARYGGKIDVLGDNVISDKEDYVTYISLI